MECAICYEQIKDHKLFKVGCCSFTACVDCIRQGKVKKCPQCQESYSWINTDYDVVKKLNQAISSRNKMLDYEKLMNRAMTDQIKDLEVTIENLKKESMIKSKYMEQMSNTIVQLIEEKEEDDQLVEDLQDVVNRLNLIP
jgi:macrodomain Ter protein organizer (MatP/YcbG family)